MEHIFSKTHFFSTFGKNGGHNDRKSGRKKILQSLIREEEPQFVAVFGRRRIGKNYLIRESFDYNFTFEHTGVSNVSHEDGKQKQIQLDSFSESLSEAGYKSPERLTN